MNNSDNQRNEILSAITTQITRLDEIKTIFRSNHDLVAGGNRLDRWKERTTSIISHTLGEEEAQKFANVSGGLNVMDPVGTFLDGVNACNSHLVVLREEIEAGMELPVASTVHPPREVNGNKIISRNVFIIHGHDDGNVLRLEKLLKDRFELVPIVLREKPGKGRTIIEKFEGEATEVCFAIAIITPDDVIQGKDGEYTQARPNVVFELGWFYGRLGRSKVSILCRKGTKIHSDLDGIERIEFHENIDETVTQLEKELKEAGVIS